MGVRSTNQHLRVFVSTNAAAFADAVPGTASDLLNDGVFAPGRVTYQTSIGTNYATVAAALAAVPGQVTVVYKGLDSKIYRSPVIKEAKIAKLVEGAAYVAPTEQVDTLTIPATPVAGDEYVVTVAVPNYGGMISQQDEVKFYASRVATSTDTASTIAASLRASLKQRLDSLPTPIIAVTGATSNIILTGLPQPYVQSKWDGKQVHFYTSLSSPYHLMAGATATAVAKPGKGTYAQVAGAEEFFAGYNSDWLNRTANFPGDGSPIFAATSGATYKSTNIAFVTEHDAVSVQGIQKQEVMVFFKI